MCIRDSCLALLSASLADAFQRPQSAARAPRAPQLVEQQALPATVVEPLAGYAEFWNGLLFRPAIEAGLDRFVQAASASLQRDVSRAEARAALTLHADFHGAIDKSSYFECLKELRS